MEKIGGEKRKENMRREEGRKTDEKKGTLRDVCAVDPSYRAA